MGTKRERKGKLESWVWDYFSIKETGIGMSVCDICGQEWSYRIYTDCLKDMREHLSTKHTDIYETIIDKIKINWESYFERVQCLITDSIHGYVKCKHCVHYNILLRVWKGQDMEYHLKVDHNVTKSDWNYLKDWRDKNTTEYYEVIRRPTESIKRTRLCKQCDGHQFQCSNLCIMLKHLIQVHNLIPNVPLDKLPKGLLQLNYPIVDTSSNQQSSISGRSDSNLEKSSTLLMAEIASFMDKYEQ